MVVPFGCSVGDVIAVSKLIKDIVTRLRNSSSSAAEYQGLLSVLNSLTETLDRLHELRDLGGEAAVTLDSIKSAAISCRTILEKFRAKIRKYDSALGGGPPAKTLPTMARKIQFQFDVKDECQELQNYLTLHLSNINTMLALHGLETIDLQRTANEQHLNDTKTIFLRIKSTLSRASGDVSTLTRLIFSVHTSVERTIDKITEWGRSLTALNQMVAMIW